MNLNRQIASQISNKAVKMLYCVFMLLFIANVSFANAQQRKISGTVVDATLAPMPGVTVRLKGTTSGTITDLDGKYSIQISSADDELSFSFIGYNSLEIKVGEQTDINVTLTESVKQLSEVVVIGYGVQKKSDLTGAVASVSAKDMQKTATNDVMSAMQGRAAGVQITTASGMPGSETQVRIRGISSINGQSPLWIIDGVASSANSVNPADIESMEILKDASTAAIYGSNGANGVVLITTKKGANDKRIRSTVNYYRGINQSPRKVDVLNGPEFGEMINNLNYYSNSKNGVLDTSLYHPLYNPDTLSTYDYQDLIFRNSLTENLDISISGGTDKLSSYFGMGYNSTEGIIKGMKYEKLNLILKNDYKFNEYVEIGNKLTFMADERTGLQEWRLFNDYNSPINEALIFAPFQAPYKIGAHPDSSWYTNPINNTNNPFLTIDLEDRVPKNRGGSGLIYASIKPIKGLKIETRFNYSMNFSNYEQFDRKFYYNASTQSTTNNLAKNQNQYQGWNLQNIIDYNTSIADMFNIGAMAGTEAGKSYQTNLSFTLNDVLSQDKSMRFLSAATGANSKLIYSENATEGKGYSYFGRLNLDYKSMFLFQGNFRRDGSSVFGPKNRFGNFIGWSGGFKFTELDYFKQFKWLSFGKLRYGMGQAGNNVIAPYTYFDMIGTGTTYAHAQYAFDDKTLSIGSVPMNLSNKAIKWETVETINYGADLYFFDNRLTFTIDRFERSNIDMLYRANIPGYAGWNYELDKVTFENGQRSPSESDPRPYANIGKISAKGLEITVGFKDKIGKLKYDFTANFTYTINKALDLKGDEKREGTSNGPLGTYNRTIEGERIGEFYGFKINKMFKPIDCDTLLVNTSTNVNRTRWSKVVKATNQPIKEIVSSYMGVNRNGDSVYKTLSGLDTIFVQNNATAGDFQFVDTNGDGVLNDKDYQSLGNAIAPYAVGFNMNLEYGWFDMNTIFMGVIGNKIFNARRAQLYNTTGQSNWSKDYYNNYYRDALYDSNGNLIESARNGIFPRLDLNNMNQNLTYPSEFYIEDGSYLKLKSIQLGLTIPVKYTEKAGITNLRIYIGAKNLFTITKYTGADPEVESRSVLSPGIDRGSYPVPRTYNAGFSLAF